MNNIFKWLSDWYIENCNGDWEHSYGIIIETLDNPGWTITIDTENSTFKLENRPWIFMEKNDSDWYGYQVEEGKFKASGDPAKLEYLVNLFKNLIENKA